MDFLMSEGALYGIEGAVGRFAKVMAIGVMRPKVREILSSSLLPS